jgi:hypothetical protein
VRASITEVQPEWREWSLLKNQFQVPLIDHVFCSLYEL